MQCGRRPRRSHLLRALLMLFLIPVLTSGANATEAGMVRLAGGAFMMGDDRGPADERPAHRVEVRSFLLDRRAVTNAEYADFLNAIGGTRNARGQHLFDWDDEDARIHKLQGRWRADPGYEHHPAVEMSWYGARDYCGWRNKRLPSEAEREFAARGAQGRTYPWGEAPPDATRARFGAGYGRTIAAGSLSAGATPAGVLDLAGNVHEWTSSIAMPYPYRADDGREDPDKIADRVTRGGAADTGASTLRAAWRGASVSRRATAGHHNIGFRCARDAE